jgi:DNA polymerase-3 subunit delta'
MQFKDIIGQAPVKQHLVEMVEQNRLSHALLFLGKEGSWALPMAMALSQYISCHAVNRKNADLGPSLFGEPEAIQPGETTTGLITDSCGTCPSCSKAAQLVHPDIHFSYPVVTKKSGTPPISTDYVSEWREFIKQLPYGNIYDWLQFIEAENKQGNITAHECNDIIRKLNLKSFESGYKTLIMWMPEYLGKEGNKLLKLIEEPPADTLFILVAENEDQILSTILSRCQLVKIPAIETEAVEKALQDRGKVNPEQAKQIAHISEGNYREALHVLQHADEDYGHLLKEWLNATLKNQVTAQVKLIEEISRLGRENQKQFLRYFGHLIESAIRLNAFNEAGKKQVTDALSTFEQDFVPKLNKAISLEQQEAVTGELDKAAYYIERNANSKILFHALTIKIFHIVRNNVLVG